MKKICLAILMIMLLGGSAWQANARQAEAPFRVLAATFPVYLFALNICDNIPNVQVELLIPGSVGCPHDFSLKPSDMRKLANANALIINGHDLEDFLAKPLAAEKLELKTLDAGVNVPTLPAAVNDHAHVNPHTFAAPAQAAIMAANIANGMAELNPENAEIYAKNGKLFADSLIALSMKFEAVGAMAQNKRMAIGHDALAYLADNAGLEVVAILETGDSIGKLTAIKKKLEKDRPVLLAGDDQYPDRVIKTLSEEIGIPYAMLNICAAGPDNPPLDYYQKAMLENLRILEKYFE